MRRESDRRRRSHHVRSHSLSQDPTPALQRDDPRPFHRHGDANEPWRSADAHRSTMPPPQSSVYLSRAAPTVPYRRPRGTLDDEGGVGIQIQSHATHGSGGRRHLGREYEVNPPVRGRRRGRPVTPDLSPSEDESDSEDSYDQSEDDSLEEADDERSMRRRRSMQQLMGPRSRSRLRPRPLESSDMSSMPGAYQRTPSTSSHASIDERHPPTYGVALPPPRYTHMTIEAPSPPRVVRPRMSSDVLDSRPPRAAKRRSRRSDPIVLQAGPRGSKKASPDSHNTPQNVRSLSRRRSSILSGILSGHTSRNQSPDRKSKKKGKDREKQAKLVECVICMGDVQSKQAPKLKCGHRMCHACLKRNFELSLTDPQLMPPRCCTEDRISLRHVDRLFDLQFKKIWNRKYAEFTTQNRLYCPSKRCGEWIKPSLIRREGNRQSARCGHCSTKVCVACNGKWHSSFDCPRDEETQRFLNQAKEEGWQRCHSCKAMVERKQGCNHMTCRCGAQFCMLCGAKWKSCDCEWFNFDLDDNNLDPFYAEGADVGDVLDDEMPLGPRQVRNHLHRRAPRPRTYGEEMNRRRLQEQQDEELARRLQYDVDLYDEYSDDDVDDDDDDDDEDDDYEMGGVENVVALGGPSRRMNERTSNYRRPGRRMRTRAPISPPSTVEVYDRRAGHRTPPTASYDRGSYVTDVNRARGVRAGSMERRLADRLSDRRQSHPPRPEVPMGFPPPMSPPGMVPHPPPPPMGGTAPYSSMRVPVGIPPHSSGTVPMMPPSSSYPFGGQMYHTGGMRGDFAPMVSRSGRRRRDSDGAPRSSSMAGLSGLGGGLNRVFEWRNFVEPGVPETDSARTSEEMLSRAATYDL